MKLNKFVIITIIFLVTSIIDQIKSQSNKLEKCGMNNPTVQTDCYTFTKKYNSCCYYKYSNNAGCVWLGTRYKGSTKYGGLYFECASGFMKIKVISLFIFLFVLL